MRVGVVLDGRRTASEIAELARLAETHGFSHVWLSGGARTKDHFVRLALAAAETRAYGSALSRRQSAWDAPARRAAGRRGDDDRHAGRLSGLLDRPGPRRACGGRARSAAVHAQQLVRVERPGDPRGGPALGPSAARLSALLHS